jgi:hypothetical protein
VIRRFFHIVRALFLWTLIIGVGISIWRPEWRRAAQRAAMPVIRRESTRLLERIGIWRPEALTAKRAAPAPAVQEEARRPAPPETSEQRGTDNSRPADRSDESQRPEQQRESGSETEDTAIAPGGNLPPRLPPLHTAPSLPPALVALQAVAQAHPSAAGYRRLADAAAASFPEVAAVAYRHEAQIYRRLGDPNAAAVEELKAGRYHSEGSLYLHSAGLPPDPPHLARLEPAYGALLGAFIDRDDQLDSTFMDENWQTHRDPQAFDELVGKKHASLFCYLRYGQPFPYRWAERLRDAGVIPHIAWEPRSLAEVADNAYLNRFADAVSRLDAPIFLRFAGEMNGDWTPYHGNPALYRQKFRLVHQVIARRAPKAALIWCVNSIPEAGIDAYYPGDDAVDWVGVNLYNVLYFDNDRSRPAAHVHPADLLQSIYSRYASRKPIALCEYAASHQAAVDPTPHPEFAITRLSQLYGALPRLFPRVKLVDWFDCNNLRHARPDRQLNDYSLSDDPKILRAYSEAIAPDYFLGQPNVSPRATIRPLRDGDAVSGIVTFSGWVRSYLDRPRVYMLVDDQVLYAGDAPGPPVCRWDARRVKPGAHEIRLVVTNSDGRRILEERRQVRVTDRL